MYIKNMIEHQEIAPEVIEQAKTNEAAFIQVYQYYCQRVFRFLLARTGNRPLAEDLAQDTFITVLTKLPQYTNTGARFSSWLLQIALNHTRMYFRKHSNASTVDLALINEFESQPNQPTAWIDFWLALHKLSAEDQDLLIMKYVEDLSNQDIADSLRISTNRCGVRIHRALNRLQQYL